jgi:uncharacterized protein YbjT (DUF2867 family)
MKIVVIGGGGLIGSKVIPILRRRGHEAVAASTKSGVNALTGEGLAKALNGAQVVVDVTNSPSFEDNAVMEFFTKSTSNLLSYEELACVRHHVALSIVGIDRSPGIGYFRAKIAQEKLIKESPIPYSIIRATQFSEFVYAIADSQTVGNVVHVPSALIQPIAADDVAGAVARVAMGSPLNGTVDVGGPEQLTFEELTRQALNARNDTRQIVVDSNGKYFGAVPSERALVTEEGAQLGEIRFADWLRRNANQGTLAAGQK